MNEFFQKRKTIRHYSDAEISDAEISELIADAMNAPTTGGMQLYSVIVTRKAEMKKKLSPCHFGQPMVTEAPVVLTFCADFNRFEKWCVKSGAKPGFRNFESFVSALLDVTIFAQQFCTAAEMEGLGCCYIGTTTYNAKEIAEVLELPKMVVPIVTLTVGHPFDADAEPKAERLPIEAIIHDERYKDYSENDIVKIYSDKEEIPANKQFVKENNKQTLAQVFTDVRYPQDASEHFSKLFFDFIEEQGFKFPK
jgi:FMN reductase (NADPH)